jgi:hypothetical protein
MAFKALLNPVGSIVSSAVKHYSFLEYRAEDSVVSYVRIVKFYYNRSEFLLGPSL